MKPKVDYELSIKLVEALQDYTDHKITDEEVLDIARKLESGSNVPNPDFWPMVYEFINMIGETNDKL